MNTLIIYASTYGYTEEMVNKMINESNHQFDSINILKNKNIDYFAQYQYGINDFPYHQLRLGISFSIEKLTPKY